MAQMKCFALFPLLACLPAFAGAKGPPADPPSRGSCIAALPEEAPPSVETLKKSGNRLAVAEHSMQNYRFARLELYRLDRRQHVVIEMTDGWLADHFHFGPNSERVLPPKSFVVANVTRKVVREFREGRVQSGRAVGVLYNDAGTFSVIYGIEHHQHYLDTQAIFRAVHPTIGDINGYVSFEEEKDKVLERRIAAAPDQRRGSPITDTESILEREVTGKAPSE